MAEEETHKDYAASHTDPPAESLGIAGRMARAFIHSPLSPLLFMAMLGVYVAMDGNIKAYDIHGSINVVGGRKPGTILDVFTASSGI